MSDKVFLDCLGRQINVGDVLANGHRDGNRISVGVVTGFTDKSIQAKKLHRGYWYYSKVYEKRRWMDRSNGDTWRLMGGCWVRGEHCFITGLTEEALKATINLESEATQ